MVKLPKKTNGDNEDYPLLEEVVLGQVGVDSGQLMVVDPLYLKDWKQDGQFFSIRRYADKDGKVYQYKNQLPKKFTEGVDEFFPNFGAKLSTGKTPNQHLNDGDWVEVKVPTGYEESFSFVGACHATLDSPNGAGVVGGSRDGFGLALATRTLFGDAIYDVIGLKDEEGNIVAIMIHLDI
ncbi:MAG: hypothetical protein HN727_02265 [Opitutae bacterium]|jgi:hypothetical protein|nr:hypothetical protein [Opitutae bacterium]